MLSRGRRVGQFGMGVKERGDVIVMPKFLGQEKKKKDNFLGLKPARVHYLMWVDTWQRQCWRNGPESLA